MFSDGIKGKVDLGVNSIDYGNSKYNIAYDSDSGDIILSFDSSFCNLFIPTCVQNFSQAITIQPSLSLMNYRCKISSIS